MSLRRSISAVEDEQGDVHFLRAHGDMVCLCVGTRGSGYMSCLCWRINSGTGTSFSSE